MCLIGGATVYVLHGCTVEDDRNRKAIAFHAERERRLRRIAERCVKDHVTIEVAERAFRGSAKRVGITAPLSDVTFDDLVASRISYFFTMNYRWRVTIVFENGRAHSYTIEDYGDAPL